jgi:sugar transferase EpsL
MTKRAMDVVVSLVGLVVLAPVVAFESVLIWRDIGRPMFFRQQRAGLGGRPITVTKLRTMTDARDAEGHLLGDAERLTPLGSRLRRLSLDELPQLWTVLKGDMSLVGPRPLPLEYVDRYSAEQRRRLEVKPGITGWSQIHGRNALSWPDKLALDVWYVDHRSLLLDIRILARTLAAVLRGAGVSAAGHATMPEFLGER